MGRLKKRADGRYCAQIYLGRNHEGKALYKSIYAATVPELKEREAEIRHQLGKGIDIKAQRDLFSTWAEDFWRIKEAAKITDRQKEHYKVSVRWWIETFDGIRLQDIRVDDIEHALLSLGKRGLAQRTVNFYHATLRQILDRAVGRALLVNPAREISPDLKAVGEPPEARRALTEEEQRWIWETPHRAQPVAVIMILSGLRRGELAALEWSDIDLEARTISVNKVIEYDAKGIPHRRLYPKTDASQRVVDIPQKLVTYLKAMPRTDGQPLVIPSARGGVMTTSGWTKLWRSYMRELNIKYGVRTEEDQKRAQSAKPGPKTYDMTIPPITLHWLRHTFCTLMYFAGVDVITASKQMGHADVTTTLRIYTHLDAIYKRKSVAKLDAYLDPPPPEENPSQ